MSGTRAAKFSESIMTWLSLTIQRNRLLAAAFVILIVGTFASFLPQLQFDNSADAFFNKNDPTLLGYQRFKEQYETDEYSLILLDIGEQWTAEMVESVERLVSRLSTLDHVVDVTALTNVRHIRGDEYALDISKFLQGVRDDGTIQQRKAEAILHPYYSGLFVTADGRHLGILVETEIIAGEIEYKIVLTNQIRALLREEPYASWNATAVGAPILDADVRTIVSTESALFGGIVFAVVGIGFWLLFRGFMGVLLPLLIATLSIVSAFGIKALIGAPVTLLTPIIPSFLISVGIGSSIFLLTAYKNARAAGLKSGDAVTRSMVDAGPPATLAILTTAAALLSFYASEIRPVMEVGVVMGLSLLVSLVLTLVMMPLVLASTRRDGIRIEKPKGAGRGFPLGWLAALATFSTRHSVSVLVGAALFLGLAAFGLKDLRTDYYYLGNFKSDVQIRQDYARVDTTLPASSVIEVLIDAGRLDAFKQPELLRRLASLQDAIKERSDIPAKSYSLADIVREIGQALHDGDPSQYQIPDSSAAVAQYLMLFESSGSDELSNLTTFDYDVARLTVRVPTLPDRDYLGLMQLIQTEAEQLFGSAATTMQSAAGDALESTTVVQIEITGLVPLWQRISSYLISSQIKSILLSFAVITIILIFAFRSATLGLLMALVNASVVVLVLGFMGWAGIMLDPYVILVASIAFGIMNDDTIHFVSRVKTRLASGALLNDAIHDAFMTAGQAMLYTTIVLVISFSAYLLSDVASLMRFGLLVALTLLLGLLIELLLTPAILVQLHRYRLLRGVSVDYPSPAAAGVHPESG